MFCALECFELLHDTWAARPSVPHNEGYVRGRQAFWTALGHIWTGTSAKHAVALSRVPQTCEGPYVYEDNGLCGLESQVHRAAVVPIENPRRFGEDFLLGSDEGLASFQTSA